MDRNRPTPDDRMWREVPSEASFFAIGAAFGLLGIAASADLLLASHVAAAVLEVAMIGAGIVSLAHAAGEFRHPRAIISALVAAVYLGTSVCLILNPGLALSALTLLVAALMVASGVSRLAVTLFVPRRAWGWLTFSGLAGVIAGTAVGMGWPRNAAWLPGLMLAADLVLHGIGFVAVGLAARAQRRKLRAGAHNARC